MTFLTNEWGRPFSGKGFGDWFREQVKAAGLGDHCVPHGLRKAKARLMAESDCTHMQMMAVGGWATEKEVRRYTDDADDLKLAAAAQAKVAKRNNVVPLPVAAGQ